MKPELRMLYDKERDLKAQSKKLIADPNATEEACNALLSQVEEVQAKIALAEATAEEPDDFEGEPLPPAHGKNLKYDAQMFYNALANKASTEEKAIIQKAMKAYKSQLTGTELEKGGYLVPDDFATSIIETIMQDESVRNLVRVEQVKTAKGRRIFRDGTPDRLHNTAERGVIEKINNPKYRSVDYEIRKYAGMMDVPSELLEDAAINFLNELRQWLGDTARETENELVLYGDGVIDPTGIFHKDAGDPYYTEIAAPDNITIGFLRRVINSVNRGYRKRGIWVMNTLTQERIAGIKDAMGREILVPDPRKEDTFTILGRPVEIYDSIVTDDGGETDFAFGDFRRGYRMFDRRAFDVKTTDSAAGTFETDTVKARGICRFDGRRMDMKAIVIVRGIDVSTAATTDPGEGLALATIDIDPSIKATISEKLAEAQETINAMVETASTDAAAIIAAAEKEAKDKLATANKEAKAITDAAKKSDTGK